MLQLNSLIDIVKRLTAALRLTKLAEEVIPTLVANGQTSQANAAVILGQIPNLRAEIDRQIQSTLAAMEAIQDRIEVLAQFLLLHRAALTSDQLKELDSDLRVLKG